MKPITSTFEEYKVQKKPSKPDTANRRSDLIKPFVERLEESSIDAGYEPYTAQFIAIKMSHIATDELKYFYDKLADSKSFGGLWHWYCIGSKKKKEWKY